MPTMPSFNKDVSVEITLQHSSSIASDEESTIDQRNLEQLHGENDYGSVAPSSSPSSSSCLKKKHVAAALALITVTTVAVGVGMVSSNSSKNKATSATAAMSEFEMYGASSSSSSKSGKSHKSSSYSRSGDDPNDEETKSPTQGPTVVSFASLMGGIKLYLSRRFNNLPLIFLPPSSLIQYRIQLAVLHLALHVLQLLNWLAVVYLRHLSTFLIDQ